jgi:hypothetical protein
MQRSQLERADVTLRNIIVLVVEGRTPRASMSEGVMQAEAKAVPRKQMTLP